MGKFVWRGCILVVDHPLCPEFETPHLYSIRFFFHLYFQARILICSYVQGKFSNRVILTKYVQGLGFVQTMDMRRPKATGDDNERLKMKQF